MQQGHARVDKREREVFGVSDLTLVEAMKRYRRAREVRPALFRNGARSDPAWDMLLFILAAGIEGRSVSISAVAGAGLVPPTTGLRWIVRLLGVGLIYREGDLRDGRRMNLRLTERGEALARNAASDLAK